MRLFLISVLLVCSFSAHSQIFDQYWQNMSQFNPAFQGDNQNLFINVHGMDWWYKNMQPQFPPNRLSSIITGYSDKLSSGAGLSLLNGNGTRSRSFKYLANYYYRLHLNQESHINIGASAGSYIIKPIDEETFLPRSKREPTREFNLNFGAVYRYNNLMIAASYTNLYTEGLLNTFYITTSYNHRVTTQLKLKYRLLSFKDFEGRSSEPHINAATIANYRNILVGVGSWLRGIPTMYAGYDIAGKFQVLYSISLSGKPEYRSYQNELSLSFRL